MATFPPMHTPVFNTTICAVGIVKFLMLSNIYYQIHFEIRNMKMVNRCSCMGSHTQPHLSTPKTSGEILVIAFLSVLKIVFVILHIVIDTL